MLMTTGMEGPARGGALLPDIIGRRLAGRLLGSRQLPRRACPGSVSRQVAGNPTAAAALLLPLGGPCRLALNLLARPAPSIAIPPILDPEMKGPAGAGPVARISGGA